MTSTHLTYVIPCGRDKLPHAAPARDLYTGTQFRHALARVEAEAAATDQPVRVLILSARHGLVDLDTVLAPYDVTMTDPAAITPATLAAQLLDTLPEGGSELYAFLPAAYLARLREAADLVDAADLDRWALVHDVYEAAPGIGYQRQTLSNLAALATPEEPDTPKGQPMTDTTNEPAAVPTDHAALVELIGATPFAERPAIRKHLAAQLGDDDHAWALFVEADDEVTHFEHIDRLRAGLRAGLDKLATDVRDVLDVLAALVEVYDVEYAEGQAAVDMRHFLVEAARGVRAAAALNPVPGGEGAA